MANLSIMAHTSAILGSFGLDGSGGASAIFHTMGGLGPAFTETCFDSLC